jgi:hypothetical protein
VRVGTFHLGSGILKFSAGAPRLGDIRGMATQQSRSMATDFAKDYKLPAYEALLGRSPLNTEEKEAAIMPTTAGEKASGWAKVAEASASLILQTSKGRPSLTQAPVDDDWYTIPEAKMTPELRRDLVLLENRAHLDPKRFYKSAGTGRKRGELPTRVQVGVVVEASHEYLSGRLTNRERKKSFADEIFSDSRLMQNARRRFAKLQDSRQNGKRVIDPASRVIRKKGGRR